MNPTFGVFQKAMIRTSIDMLMGVHPATATKKPTTPATEGRLFPRSDMVEEAEEAAENAEKERKARAHLNQLAIDAKARSDAHDR